MSTSIQNEPEEGYIYASDGMLHYLNWGGSGRQTHLLHANGFCAGTYTPFVKYLTGDLHIIGSDVRGHGASTRLLVKRISHWNIFAQDLKRVIEQTLHPPVIGIGHSLGAVTTYIAAAEFPDLFSAVILIDPVILPKRMLWELKIMRMFGLTGTLPLARGARKRRKFFKNKQEAFERFARGRGIFKSWSKDFISAYLGCGLLQKDEETAILKCDPELEAQIFESVPLNVWKYGKKIACPVLAIRGQFSDTFYPDAAERLERMIPDFTLKTISGAGHFIPMEKPEACAKAILEFIHDHDTVPSKEPVPPKDKDAPPVLKQRGENFSSEKMML